MHDDRGQSYKELVELLALELVEFAGLGVRAFETLLLAGALVLNVDGYRLLFLDGRQRLIDPLRQVVIILIVDLELLRHGKTSKYLLLS